MQPVTKAELDQRIARRETPKHEHHLRPDMGTQDAVKQASSFDNEQRIRFIQDRLGRTKNKAKREFKRSR